MHTIVYGGWYALVSLPQYGDLVCAAKYPIISAGSPSSPHSHCDDVSVKVGLSCCSCTRTAFRAKLRCSLWTTGFGSGFPVVTGLSSSAPSPAVSVPDRKPQRRGLCLADGSAGCLLRHLKRAPHDSMVPESNGHGKERGGGVVDMHQHHWARNQVRRTF